MKQKRLCQIQTAQSRPKSITHVSP